MCGFNSSVKGRQMVAEAVVDRLVHFPANFFRYKQNTVPEIGNQY